MNEQLREEHLGEITNEKARHVYDQLCAACDRREGGMEDADQMLVADIAFAEQVKEMLKEDILKRGIGKEMSNGRQRYWQDNKSLAHLRAYCESQRKHLNELRLTPVGRKAAQIQIDDDFDSFPD